MNDIYEGKKVSL